MAWLPHIFSRRLIGYWGHRSKITHTPGTTEASKRTGAGCYGVPSVSTTGQATPDRIYAALAPFSVAMYELQKLQEPAPGLVAATMGHAPSPKRAQTTEGPSGHTHPLPSDYPWGPPPSLPSPSSPLIVASLCARSQPSVV